MKIKNIVILVIALILITGCGSSSSSGEFKKTYKGYLIDAPIVNLSYKCGEKVAKTQTDGFFSCTELPITFF